MFNSCFFCCPFQVDGPLWVLCCGAEPVLSAALLMRGPMAMNVLFMSSRGGDLKEHAERAVQTMHQSDSLASIPFAGQLRTSVTGLHIDWEKVLEII